jgi:C-terminal processing protease CtpA/Prc
MMRRRLIGGAAALLVGVASVFAVSEDNEVPPATIINDEGGPQVITGSVEYTNGFFTLGVDQPLIILEDQTGFVTRDRGYDIPIASQVLGQITSDFFTSPFTYSVTLPQQPNAPLNDVDQDGDTDTGVIIYAIAYWTNIWGDPYLELRDLFGGGWSGAYASTRVNANSDRLGEYDGGKVLIWAPDDQQGFPAGFGEDNKLFTEDDPIVRVPAGYTLVDMDTDPFTFDRSARPVVDLIEGEGAEADDFSDLSYTEAFDAMLDKFRREYAYTELKGIDWDAKSAEFRPRFEAAETEGSTQAYYLALRDFIASIPDEHLDSGTFNGLYNQFLAETEGGIGLAIRKLDDGRVLANFILEGGPADEAGIELRAEIISMNGTPVMDYVSAIVPWSAPFSTPQNLELQQLRYATRFLNGTEIEVEYRNPGDAESTTVTLTAIPERDSFAFSSFNAGRTGYELPLEFRPIEETNYLYVKIWSFADSDALLINLWERMIEQANANGVEGIIIDMRQNGGGSGWLADQMAAYFFDEPLVLGNSAVYDEVRGEFYVDPDVVSTFILPSEDMRYRGPVAVLVGPACASACEFFAYNVSLQGRSAVVGQYATGGLAGGQEIFFMPEDLTLQLSVARNLDAEGNVIIEGVGVVPTIKVPVDEETLFAETDVVLDAAVAYFDELLAFEVIEGGALELNTPVEGQIAPRQRVNYTFNTGEGGVVDFVIESEAGAFLNILLQDGTLAAAGTTPDDPGFEEVELPPNFDLIIQVLTTGDSGEGSFTISVVPSE